jgi:formate dehydrogenase iron-sulfur subunit
VHARMTSRRFDALLQDATAPRVPEPTAGARSAAAVTMRVPRDSTALAAGADDVAAAIAAGAAARAIDVALTRNGTRGMFWLEPLVEVDTGAGRIGYGPVSAGDVASLFDAGFHHGGAHPLRLGRVGDLPWLKSQQRLTFARIGIADPLSLADYEAQGGTAGLRRAMTMAPEAIVAEVTDSGLRGRGGAAFPTGIKWQTAARTHARQKYVVCNADEGDSGSFADRLLMESDPFALIEGMTIAGLAVGATQGYVYVRSEYPHALAALEAAIGIARDARLLGTDILGSGTSFDLDVRMGAGSYVCGEETAMLESLEGKRGIVRAKPPLPAVAGLFGMPTVVNNVVTLATVPLVLARGAAFYRDFGTGRSRGTLALQLAGNVTHGGLIEVAFGITLRQLIEQYGGGTASSRPIRAIQVGGPLGTYVPPQHWDTPLDYEAYAALGHVIGHGSVVVHDDTVDMAKMARCAMEFCALESCGKCSPCRIGSVRGVEIIDRIVEGRERAAQVALLRELAGTMLHGSLCAMGGMTPYPVLSALEHYPEDFGVDHERDRTAPAR